MGHIDKGEWQMAHVMCQIAVPTPGTVEDHMQMLENKLAEYGYTIAMLTYENVRSPHSESQSREVTLTCREPPVANQGVELLTTESSDNSAVGSGYSLVGNWMMFFSSAGSPIGSDKSSDPIPDIFLSFLFSMQGDQGEAANIMEATALAGEADPVITEEGGISGEHHQMMEENSGECATEGEGGTTILVSEGQVGEVSGMIAEEELGLTGGKFPEEH
ncbi:hypothetical protein EDD16DRAFT_1519063 [Pisolithus croceorrhizus]|nr:hypothetical protein EDD16DRAFT_1519063 [Pisolithus croceorrhizus]KAI6122099.1 hypothetical protein EV401DRAFT_1887323 [Pisolithus croceorrhizus]